MFGKLAWRNMRRSVRDYLVYVLTMTIITAFMYAFNSLIFQNELTSYFDFQSIMGVMLGLATVFIVLIVAWLINYMVRFMLEKRSSEFGIYLLLGIKKKTISRLYIRENMLLGLGAFLAGIVLGVLLSQVLMAILFSMVRMEYHLHISFNKWTILMTVLCYMGCYLLALLRCKRKFRKMNISDLMNAKRRNEEIKEKHETVKRILLPGAIGFILLFWAVFKKLSNAVEIVGFLIGLVLTIYLFYVGVSAWMICYVRDRKKGIYRGQNLFLLRQFAAKVRTIQFTMGTLTALFTIALLGAAIALMFSDYENTVLDGKFPFDVQIYSSDAADDFADDIEIIKENTQPLDMYPYRIYTDGSSQANAWMLSHLHDFGEEFRREDGSPDMEKIDSHLHSEDRWSYCITDTYMGISDYNHLRKMLGYDTVSLETGNYLLHIKSRLRQEVEGIENDLEIKDASGEKFLSCAGVYDEEFSQSGHNGGDYLLIVPDEVLQRMQPYYSVLAADIKGEAPVGLTRKLDALAGAEEREDFSGHAATIQLGFNGNECCGSDNILSFSQDVLVRDNMIPEVKFILASVIVPTLYIGLVFVCVAMTVLSVQQLSDSVKYKFRYDVLKKLGLGRLQIRGLIRRQLVAYYLCPVLLAMVISGRMVLYISGIFVLETGVPLPVWAFFGKSVALFFGIYFIYFMVTYIGFQRNIEGNAHMEI